ncbi:MAG: glycosyltransferase family 4 protein [Patescibacteria group bacterium]
MPPFNSKKILVVTPSFPFTVLGAEQSDRAFGIKQLRNLGFEVRVITKTTAWQSPEDIQRAEDDLSIKLIPVSYKYSNRQLSLVDKINKVFLKIRNPLLLDGAALEYSDPEIKKKVIKEITDWKPDLVWFDYTYLWPLYGLVKKYKIPIITRSINFEPSHFLQEDGWSIINLFKYIPKLISELLIIKNSDIIFAITPKEEGLYKKLGGREVYTLPLRGLPACFQEGLFKGETKPLEVIFMGSTYNVAHNRRALEFILRQIAPDIHRNYPGGFRFNIIGRKMPPDCSRYLKDNVKYHGYVDNLKDFLAGMDIALVPSFFGAGMQQKIFEPLCRGIPTITSRRGTAGYPFEHKKEIWLADNLQEFVEGLIYLENPYIRKDMGLAGRQKAEKIFSKKSLDKIVISRLEQLFLFSKIP